MELQIYRIVFSANNPHGGYVAGDVIDILVETDNVIVSSFGTSGVIVRKNGVTITSNSYLIEYTPKPYKTMSEYNPTFCVGVYYTRYIPDSYFPYALGWFEKDHPSCVVNSPVCDLIVVGQPEVVPSSGATDPDGSITVSAQSTNPIKYKIGSDFSYEDGTAQTENTFTELLPGQYRIYLADSKNCKANVLVIVPISTEYNPKYRLEYNDLIGGITRIDVGQRGYNGSITEVCATGNPLTLSMRGEGEDDKFTPIIATDAVVELLTSVDGQFRELYTNDPELYRITIYKAPGGVFIEADPFDEIPLSTWTNVNAPGVATSWTTGISEPTVLTSDDSDYLTSPTVTGITAGRYFLYLRVNTTGPFRAVVEFLKLGVSVGSVEANLSNGQTNNLIVTITDSPDTVRIQVEVLGGLQSRATILSISMPSGVESIWQGKVIPGIIEEEYTAAPYTFTLRATDGIPRLRDIYLMQDDGQTLTGTVSVIKLIAYCLAKIKLGLNIRVACNIYATGMSTTDSSDPLHQSYVDYDLFYIRNSRPTLEDVLVTILDSFGARLVQWAGYWNIVRIEEMVGEYDYRVFTVDGNYIFNDSYSPVLNLGYPDDNEDLIFVKADQNLEIRPGFGTMRVVYRLGYKDNILKNGNFRLKTTPGQSISGQQINIDTFGFTLYTGDYPKYISHKTLDDSNVALVVTTSDASVIPGDTLSQFYFVKMGANNELEFTIRYAVEDAVRQFGSTRWNEGALYTKVRIVIQYGPLYLTSSGTWTADYNEITIFASEFFKFQDYDLIAPQPNFQLYDEFITYSSGSIVYYAGTHWASLQYNNIDHTPVEGSWWTAILITPVDGMYFRVKVFDAFVNYAQFTTLDDFKSFDTVNTEVGFKTEALTAGEIHVGDPGRWMDYYELEEGTDAELLPEVIRSYDYNGSTNRKIYRRKGGYRRNEPVNTYQSFYIDKIQVSFLTDGKAPIDTIVRDRDGEPNNKDIYVKEFYIGSYSNLIVTNTFFSFGYVYIYNLEIGVQSSPSLTTVTENVLSADLIYAGYLRSSNGTGWDTWARDGIAESDKLHGIMLRVYAAQYKKSWRRMRGSFHSNTTYFGFLNVIREINADNRIYMPIGLTIDDKNNIYSGELLELANIYENPGSDGSGEAPYSSGFTTGFGASGFN